MNQILNIGILDSGAGGLTILNEILHRKLSCNIVYISDTEKYPYGVLSEGDLKKRVIHLINKTLQEVALDACIIACNTASTAVLPELRARWQLPFIGVVPAVKPAAAATRSGVIGVLATPGTISRPYVDELIANFAGSTTVYKYGSKLLVELAENYIRSGELNESRLGEEVAKLTSMDDQIDTIVLACTHFPLLKRAIFQSIKKPELILLDSTQAIINRLESLFPRLQDSATIKEESLCRFFNTSQVERADYVSFIQESNKETAISFSQKRLSV